MSSTSLKMAGVSIPPLTAPQRDAMRALPVKIVSGLRMLRDESGPMGVRPDVWAVVAKDAIRLAANGWVRQALDLGWSAHDLFGVDPIDSDDFAGLAVWLNGRSINLIDPDRAIVVDRSGRSFFNRGGFGHGKDAVRPPVLL
ncbi:MAG TPA: hypothetical protein VF463_19190 [Sphingobium sp.]